MKKALLGLLIWLVIPAGVAAVAFYFVGPNLGQIPEAKRGAQAVTDLVAASTGQSSAPAETAVDKEAAKMETKSKIEVDPDPVKRSRNKHRRPEISVVKDGVPKEEDSPVDEDQGGPVDPDPDPPLDQNDPSADPASNPGDTATNNL